MQETSLNKFNHHIESVPGWVASEKMHDKASRKPYHTIANQHLALSAKRTGIKEDKGSIMMLAMWLLWLVKKHISG